MRFLPLFLIAISAFGAVDAEAWRKNAEAGVDALRSGKYALAEKLLQQVVDDAAAFSEKDIRRPAAITNLALVYRSTKRPDKAEALFRKALSLYEKGRGPEDKETLNAVSNLGTLLRDTKKYSEAEPLLRRAIATADKLESHSLKAAGARANLALMLEQAGRPKEASPFYQEALHDIEAARGANAPEMYPIVLSYSGCLRKLGETDKAAQMDALAKRIAAPKPAPKSALKR